MVHAWKETGEVPRGASGASLRRKLKKTEVSRAALWAYGLHEVPLAYNVLSGEARALVLPLPFEKKAEWKAQFDSSWVVGTADYVGVLLEQPWVDDLKTGRRVSYGDHLYQQAFYSLAWGVHHAGKITTVRSTITHWPRYPVENKPTRFGSVLEVDFFLDFADKLRTLHRTIHALRGEIATGKNIIPKMSPGEHCVYCPSRSNCSSGQRYLDPNREVLF